MVTGPLLSTAPASPPTRPGGYHLLCEDGHVRGGPLQREEGQALSPDPRGPLVEGPGPQWGLTSGGLTFSVRL